MGIPKKTIASFQNEINKLFNNSYTILSKDYINNITALEFKHNKCGKIFSTKPMWFLKYKEPCPVCSNKKRLKTHNEFLEEVYNKYRRRIYYFR